jgi:hypothetical protein
MRKAFEFISIVVIVIFSSCEKETVGKFFDTNKVDNVCLSKNNYQLHKMYREIESGLAMLFPDNRTNTFWQHSYVNGKIEKSIYSSSSSELNIDLFPDIFQSSKKKFTHQFKNFTVTKSYSEKDTIYWKWNSNLKIIEAKHYDHKNTSVKTIKIDKGLKKHELFIALSNSNQNYISNYLYNKNNLLVEKDIKSVNGILQEKYDYYKNQKLRSIKKYFQNQLLQETIYKYNVNQLSSYTEKLFDHNLQKQYVITTNHPTIKIEITNSQLSTNKLLSKEEKYCHKIKKLRINTHTIYNSKSISGKRTKTILIDSLKKNKLHSKTKKIYSIHNKNSYLKENNYKVYKYNSLGSIIWYKYIGKEYFDNGSLDFTLIEEIDFEAFNGKIITHNDDFFNYSWNDKYNKLRYCKTESYLSKYNEWTIYSSKFKEINGQNKIKIEHTTYREDETIEKISEYDNFFTLPPFAPQIQKIKRYNKSEILIEQNNYINSTNSYDVYYNLNFKKYWSEK